MLDIDLQLGDALAALCLQPEMNIAQALEIIREGGVAPASKMANHESGISVLSQVGAVESMGDVTPDGISEVLAHLRGQFNFVVVDGINNFSESALAVVDAADKIVIVTMQDVLAMRRARWMFDVLQRLGVKAHDITVAVNQFDASSRVSIARLEQMFSPAPVIAIQQDEALAFKSLDRGMPLHRVSGNAGMTQDINRLAGVLSDEVAYQAGLAPMESSSSIMGMLRRKR
jgi:pilus assembly protein CpaE